jgi:hypothetical protein
MKALNLMERNVAPTKFGEHHVVFWRRDIPTGPSRPMEFGMLILIAKAMFFVFMSVFISVTALLIVSVSTKSGRKELRMLWREDSEDSSQLLHVCAVLKCFVIRKATAIFVYIARRVYGDEFIPDPTDCIPRFTTIQTQADRIILNWQAPRPASKLTNNQFELQVCTVCPGAGGGADKVREWEVLHVGDQSSYDYKQLDPGKSIEFRVRTTNERGASDWAVGEFSTRCKPVEGGGDGPG